MARSGTARRATPVVAGPTLDEGLRVLARVGEASSGAADEAEVVAALTQGALDLSARAAAVWLADPATSGGVRLVGARAATPSLGDQVESRLRRLPAASRGRLTLVLRTGRMLTLSAGARFRHLDLDQPRAGAAVDVPVSEEVRLDRASAAVVEELGLGPVVLVPIRGHRTTVGVLAVARSRDDPPWTPIERETLALAARQAAMGLTSLRSARERELATAAAHAEQARAADLLEAMDARAALLTRDGVVLAANSRWRAAVADRSGARAPVVTPGASWLDLLRAGPSAAVREFAEHVQRVLQGDQEVARLDGRDDEATTEVVALPGGTHPAVEAQGAAVVLQTDATWRRRLEDELTHRALHDELTGLPNRAALREGLEASLRRMAEGDMLAVLFLDLDGFKEINDGLGHAVGDQVLVAVARRLRQRCRSADIVARFGGDEFVIVLPVPDVGRAHGLADRLVDVLAEPIVVGDAEVAPGASIGITVVDRPPAGPDPVGTLLRDADTAMYHAKQRGRGRFEFFDASLQVHIAARLELASALRRADMDAEFGLRYQARRFCGTRGLAGVEALLTWRAPDDTAVQPEHFVPIAERTGRIVQIGHWVIERALREVAARERAGHGPLPVAINVSPRQLGSPGFVPLVDRAITESGVPADRVLLEITEGALVDDPQAARGVLTDLRRLGVQIALDDFGTGWSSLSYLRDLPVDVIKIDRSFVADLPVDPDACAVVAGVLGLGHGMGLVVVAEGVERADQLEVLRDMGCDEYQGFIDGEPGPLDLVVRDRSLTGG